MFQSTVVLLLALVGTIGSNVDAFAPTPLPAFQRGVTVTTTFGVTSGVTRRFMVTFDDELFEDDEEMIDIAKNYLHAKYQQQTQGGACTKDDAIAVLKSVLPPVTMEELNKEVDATLKIILENPKNSIDSIEEDDFVDAIIQNSYWKSAGGIVVKELMYFDSLYSYYRTGKALLNDDDYSDLKDSLTWEGSSVAGMNAKEALFVTAVASSRRGEPIMDDTEYIELKSELQKQGSWVTDRAPDALEKLGLNTFMGYLHRALA